MSLKRAFFPNFDSIRTIAAYMVMLHHSTLLVLYFKSQTSEVFNFFSFFLKLGGLGVVLFFCLSGFLITYLLLEEKFSFNQFKIGNFYMRRVLRIWPLYFVIVVVGFFIIPWYACLKGNCYSPPYKIEYFLIFLANFEMAGQTQSGPIWDHIVGPLWSICIEEQFYLFWPLLFFLPRRALLIAIIAVLLTSVGYRIAYSGRNDEIYISTVACFMYLSAGGLAAYFSFFYPKNITRIFDILPGWITPILFFSSLIWKVHLDQSPTIDHTVCDIFLALAFVWLLVEQSYSNRALIQLGRISFLNFWGKYTYGMYLLHSIAFWCVFQVVAKFDIESFSPLIVALSATVLGFILTHIFAYFSYNYFEKYFLMLRSRFSISDLPPNRQLEEKPFPKGG